MATQRIEFADINISLPDGWFDITDDLPAGSPFTLARSDGMGALQFSMGKYRAGPLPKVEQLHLDDMLRDFGEKKGLGHPTNIRRMSRAVVLVSGDFLCGDDFVRVWYVSNGRDVAFVTYIAGLEYRDLIAGELLEADSMVESISI